MQVLETATGIRALLEPDNEGISAPAIWGKRHRGRFPALRAGDQDPAYRSLWSWILAGAPVGGRLSMASLLMRGVQRPTRTRFLQGRPVPLMRLAGAIASHPDGRSRQGRDTGRLVVKSVHAPLAVDWLASEFEIDVLVLLRHPGNVLASWLDLSLNERFVRLEEDPAVRDHFVDRWGLLPPGPEPLERMIWQIGLLTAALEEAAAAHPGWVLQTHEGLCRDPRRTYRGVFDALGLNWTDATEAYLASHDRAGEGFLTDRVAADLPDRWQHRLTDEQVDQMRRILGPMPLRTWRPEDFTLPSQS
jgi:hypothetical protein